MHFILICLGLIEGCSGRLDGQVAYAGVSPICLISLCVPESVSERGGFIRILTTANRWAVKQ